MVVERKQAGKKSEETERPESRLKPSSPPAGVEGVKSEREVVMNGDGRKGASSSEVEPKFLLRVCGSLDVPQPSPAVKREGGSSDTQLEALRYENNKLKSALASR